MGRKVAVVVAIAALFGALAVFGAHNSGPGPQDPQDSGTGVRPGSGAGLSATTDPQDSRDSGTGAAVDSPGTITWDATALPEIQYKEVVISGVEEGFEAWEQENEALDFERSDGSADINIRWETEPALDHVGLAESTGRNRGTITIHLGDYDCNGRYVQWGKDAIAETTMHEIGHMLGLEHHSDEGHLMYGDDEFVQDDFQTLGYNIPGSSETAYFVGEGPLRDRLGDLDAAMAPLEARLSAVDAEYVGTIEQWGMTRGEYESGEYSPSSVRFNSTMAPVVDEYNRLVSKLDPMVNEYNDLSDAVNCYWHGS